MRRIFSFSVMYLFRFFFFLMIRRPPRSTRLTHSFPTRRSSDLFTVFTYIQPILTQVTGFSIGAVSPILLVFGAGLTLGNIAGGRLADRGLSRALIGSLLALAIVLVVLEIGRAHV